jgi:hypothetical protein
MNESVSILQRLRRLMTAGFFSARNFVLRSLTLAALYGLAHVAGLREYTSFLSGTSANPELGFYLAGFLGLVYLLLHFAFILLVPILLIAAGLLFGWEKLQRRRVNVTPNESISAR